MPALSIYLFGKFSAESEIGPICDLNGAKVKELFCYLLLNSKRPHLREALATLLWADLPTNASKRYLRKTLWQIQMVFDKPELSSLSELVSAEAEWIQLNHDAALWLDVTEFERGYRQAEDVSGEDLTPEMALRLGDAVTLYRGDLLEGWYQEWCLFERERLERMYLIMLEKLICHCMAHGKYEAGIAYGMQVLRRDPARERTHRHLMRLHYLTGNRSEALWQYEQCVEFLHKELGVAPSPQTIRLRDEILSGELSGDKNHLRAVGAQAEPPLQQTLAHLVQILDRLTDSQQEIHRDIEHVEAILAKIRRDGS